MAIGARSFSLNSIFSGISKTLPVDLRADIAAALLYKNISHLPDSDILEALGVTQPDFENAQKRKATRQKWSKLLGIPQHIQLSNPRSVAEIVTRLAADDYTKDVLHFGLNNLWLKQTFDSDDHFDLNLRFPEGVRKITIPNSSHSFWSIMEILSEESYKFSARCPEFIFDFGANIGLSALYLHNLFPSAKLVAVEAHKSSFELLKHNLEQNGIDADCIHSAISNEDNQITLNLNATGGLLHSICFSQEFGNSKTEQVPSRTVASLFSDYRPQSWGLKIDIEGAEHRLLFPDKELARSEWIIGELHWGHLEPSHGFEELVLQLEQCNFFEPRITVGADQSFQVAVDFHAIRQDNSAN